MTDTQDHGGVFCGTTGLRLDTMTKKQQAAHRAALPVPRLTAQGKLEPVYPLAEDDDDLDPDFVPPEPNTDRAAALEVIEGGIEGNIT